MAKSKGKIELQIEIKTQEQWDELLSKEGLIVVDTYSAWCGPCKAIVSSFKRLKNELGDDLLLFATAETDGIDSLEAYKMKSQPTFLFYAGGVLVNVIRGCKCPLLIKTIRMELEKEHKVLNEDVERVAFVDQEALKETLFEETKDEEKAFENEEEEIVEVPKQLTVAIIKPDAVKAGLVDEIIQKVQESGMEICHKEEKWFSKEEAEEFYKQHKGSDHFDQLVEFMSSGPCMTLVLSKGDEDDDAISYFRELIGPTDAKRAKEQAPTSLRALYGTDMVMNAVHGCDSSESAARELAFFYPDFVAPTKKRKKRRLQRTLALIRPDALRTRRESILAKIEEAGFSIAMSKEITLTREQAESFYSEHKNTEIFETLVTNMTSGPMMALCLAREDAVAGWRELLGPKEIAEAAEQVPESLRQQFHVEGSPINPLHGSASPEAAEQEIQQFFPMQSTVAVIKPDIESSKRGDIIQRIKEAGFKIQYEKEITMDKELASQFYSEHKGKDFFEGLTDYMSSGPTLFMVLTREDAVSGWRALMGPTDPQEAADRAPKSLRAQFGFDKMKNAVHGSSNLESAESVIKDLFPELDILPDGSVEVLGEQGRDEEKHIEPRQEIYSEALGMESGAIPDDSITASSELDDQHSASKARLNTNPEGKQLEAWVPLETDTNQWLQVDIGKITRITKIASQGEAGDSGRHVRQFILSYNLTGDNQEFVPYCEDNAVKVFEGNSDQTTVVYNELRYPVLAKFVRLNPQAWNEGIALRTELYGHDAETFSEPLGMENSIIPDYAITASSVLNDQHSAYKARLNGKAEELTEAWIPLESDENQWLQVDLGEVAVMTKVATQGGGTQGQYVSSYIMLFSQDEENFQPYEENGETKVFQGNSDESSVVTQWFTKPVNARYCRLQPRTWDEQIALRMELYGRPPAQREAKGDVPSLQRKKEDDIVEKTQHDEEQSDGESNLVVKPDEQVSSHEPEKTGEVLDEPAVKSEDRPEATVESKAEETEQETVNEGVNEEQHTAEEENLSSGLKPEDQEAADLNNRDEKNMISRVDGDEENKLADSNGDEESKITETSEDEGSRPTKANEDEDFKATDGDEENKPTEVPGGEKQSTPSSEGNGGNLETAEGSEGREAESVKNTEESQSDETKPTAEE